MCRRASRPCRSVAPGIHAAFDGTGWNIDTVVAGSYGPWYPSLALDASGHPRVSFLAGRLLPEGYGYDLLYGSNGGGGWSVESVDTVGDVGWYASLALDGADNPHIAYYDQSNGDLKYATYDGAAWRIESVDTTGDVGWYASLALDAHGRPHIAYYDLSDNELK